MNMIIEMQGGIPENKKIYIYIYNENTGNHSEAAEDQPIRKTLLEVV